MQRYHATSCTSAVNSSTVGVGSARDTARADSSSLPGNYQLNSRRSTLLTAYKLKCEKDPLNSRLGPPDFHPQTPNCPEETLTIEYVQSGYKETVEGLEEVREISLTQVQAFAKPVVLKCKEAIRKCLRAINESRAQKRKAGQVYGVPLSGPLVCKPGFPEQRPCGEEARRKWMEGLSQQHKRLRTLADHVPHGYKKKSLFEVLIRNNIPLLRATWFIKVTYLNQVRPGSAALSSGTPDKTQAFRTELWTKDVIEYLQHLVVEFSSKNSSYSAPRSRDRSSQMLYAGSVPQRMNAASPALDGEDPSLHVKWWYMVRLVQWHHAEGLLLPSLIVEWVLNQLQEKEMFEILQLLLPIVCGVLETIVLSQTYVRNLVGIAVRFIQEPSPGGSNLIDNSRRAYTVSALIEMVRYLILAVPDTFVALDCFPLPPCIATYRPNHGSFTSKATEDPGKFKNDSAEVYSRFQGTGIDSEYGSLSFDHVIATIQRSADDLAKSASPGYPRHNVAKAVQALDKALSDGDTRIAYRHLFEDLCDGPVDEAWVAEVSPCLRSSLRWIGTVSSSFICSVFFLCEWATCEFRDLQAAVPHDVKFTGRKDFSAVYVVIQLLKQWILDSKSLPRRKSQPYNSVSRSGRTIKSLDAFESPGLLHDILVCWIDQHEVHKGGAKRLQLLVFELIRSGIFYPQAYVRQLIVSEMIDTNGPLIDLERRKRHYRILKQLPGWFIRDALEEAKILEGSELLDAVQTFSNERRLLLRELLANKSRKSNNLVSDQNRKNNPSPGRFDASATSVDLLRTYNASSYALPTKNPKSDAYIVELKEAISVLLQFPGTSSVLTDSAEDDSLGSAKRPCGSVSNNRDQAEATPGCDDCRRQKRQKLSEERSSYNQGNSLIPSDDEDAWWVRKGIKSSETVKVDPPPKSTKQVPRSRQKSVRKTQSLAQLQAARIESSQGASTSHVCDSKVSCPHHGTVIEGENHKAVGGIRTSSHGDMESIGKSLKQLRFAEKRLITVWLMSVVRKLVEEAEKNVARVGHGQFNKGMTAEDRSSTRWKLGEDELSVILYLMDISVDFVSAVRFLLWLLPKANCSPSFTFQSGRNLLIMPRNMEKQTCEVGEAFLLSSLRRYENILIAVDLIPEALLALMTRATAIMASNGRLSSSPALIYARHLLKRYRNLASVVEWEKKFKATYDKRLLSELDRPADGEFGIPLGIDNPDDYLRQKISSSRLSRVGVSMRDVVQRHVDEACRYIFSKERKLFTIGTAKSTPAGKTDDMYQIAQQIIVELMDCIRQTGGAAQEGDPSLVSSAVSAIVSSIGPALVEMPDFMLGNNCQNRIAATGSFKIARHILGLHITCLCLLKEALGERQSRVFEVAFATETTSALAGVFAPGKGSRNQYQLSPKSYDSNANLTNENLNGSGKVAYGKAAKVTAAISALVVGAIIHGVTTLERLVDLLRLKDGLDFIQFVRSTKSTSNGNARSGGVFKVETSVEVYAHLFRLLVGNCKTLSDGLVVELIGEPSITAISRMQRMLPLDLVFPPAYSIFAFVLWRPFILSSNANEDTHRVYQSLTMAISDAIRHLPFRDVCLRDTRGFYDLIVADSTDAEFASMLELNGLDMHLKSMAFIPHRARLFLNAMVDCKMPPSTYSQDVSIEPKSQVNGAKFLDKIVCVLDSLQPARFHWQWVELRLLLNEQALVEKLENHDMSLAEAIRSSSPSPEKPAVSENENNFIEIILTRLLVRPDAVPLFSEVVHLFGRSLEDSMLMLAKWFLAGQDVLFGRKTIRQRLINIAESKGLPTKTQFWKPWGWCKSSFVPAAANRLEKKRKLEISSIEEGEVVEEVTDSKNGSSRKVDRNSDVCHQFTTERAFVELVLPRIDQSSEESRSTFANDLIKQLNNIEQQINSVNRGSNKQIGAASSGTEVSSNKGSSRKGTRGGSPGMSRRLSNVTPDVVPPSTVALRASMSLRSHFLLRLLPTICADREPSGRNMRCLLASIILRLLGSRIIYEDTTTCSPRVYNSLSKTEIESMAEPSALADLSGENLFDRLLFVLHGLLSNRQPSWLRPRIASKLASESLKDFAPFDRDAAESLQNELERLELPDIVRWRIQAAMPILLSSIRCSLSCLPPPVTASALSLLQHSVSGGGFQPGASSTPQRNPTASLARIGATMQGKSKQTPPQEQQQQQQELDTEIDPWTLLEDAAGSGPSSYTSNSENANLKATSWLKGAIRVRRTDLTYIGALDDDS